MPELGFWERLDLPFARLAITLNTLFTTATAVFRGKASPKKFKHHVIAAAIRKYSERMSYRQQQCVPSKLTLAMEESNDMANMPPCGIGTLSHRPGRFTGQ